jgi:catechol 2,3-dioxygenase-like lactoylglutathione lyase family enzyme
MKLGHIGLPVSDIEKAKSFYDAIAQSVGLNQLADHDDFVGYGSDDSYEFYIHTGKPGVTGLHVCFEVGSREDVQKFYDAGLAAGGADNGAPGIREDYSPTYFAAFLIDPDGNNIEAVCRD